MFNKLPKRCLLTIFGRLPTSALLSVAETCSVHSSLLSKTSFTRQILAKSLFSLQLPKREQWPVAKLLFYHLMAGGTLPTKKGRTISIAIRQRALELALTCALDFNRTIQKRNLLALSVDNAGTTLRNIVTPLLVDSSSEVAAQPGNARTKNDLFFEMCTKMGHKGLIKSILCTKGRKGIELYRKKTNTRHQVCESLAIDYAASKGYLNILLWMQRDGWHLAPQVFSGGCRGGQLKIVQWADKLWPWKLNYSQCMASAARGGHLHLVEWISATKNQPCNHLIASQAASRGHIAILEWIKSQNVSPWDENTCIAAAAGCHLETLIWLREQGSCAWDSRVWQQAVRNNSFDIMRYAFDNYCPWNEHVSSSAAESGHLSALAWLFNRGCPVNMDTIGISAAKSGDIALFKWASKKGALWNSHVMEAAMRHGHRALVDYLAENLCPHDRERVRLWKMKYQPRPNASSVPTQPAKPQTISTLTKNNKINASGPRSVSKIYRAKK